MLMSGGVVGCFLILFLVLGGGENLYFCFYEWGQRKGGLGGGGGVNLNECHSP